jgi:hypothetical protein
MGEGGKQRCLDWGVGGGTGTGTHTRPASVYRGVPWMITYINHLPELPAYGTGEESRERAFGPPMAVEGVD